MCSYKFVHSFIILDAGETLSPQLHRGAVVLSLSVPDVSEESASKRKIVGYEAMPTNEIIDMSKIGAHPSDVYFKPVFSRKGAKLTLEKDRFYILATKERISVPLHLSAEMVPFSQVSPWRIPCFHFLFAFCRCPVPHLSALLLLSMLASYGLTTPGSLTPALVLGKAEKSRGEKSLNADTHPSSPAHPFLPYFVFGLSSFLASTCCFPR